MHTRTNLVTSAYIPTIHSVCLLGTAEGRQIGKNLEMGGSDRAECNPVRADGGRETTAHVCARSLLLLGGNMLYPPNGVQSTCTQPTIQPRLSSRVGETMLLAKPQKQEGYPIHRWLVLGRRLYLPPMDALFLLPPSLINKVQQSPTLFLLSFIVNFLTRHFGNRKPHLYLVSGLLVRYRDLVYA